MDENPPVDEHDDVMIISETSFLSCSSNDHISVKDVSSLKELPLHILGEGLRKAGTEIVPLACLKGMKWSLLMRECVLKLVNNKLKESLGATAIYMNIM